MLKPKKDKSFKKVNDIFVDLAPYVLTIDLDIESLTSDKGVLKFNVTTLFPNNWVIEEYEDYSFIEVDSTVNAYKYLFTLTNNDLILDDLLNHIKFIINKNTEQEEKERKFNELVEKEKKAFESKLEKMKDKLFNKESNSD